MADGPRQLAMAEDGTLHLSGQFDHRSVLEARAEGEALIRSLGGRRVLRIDLAGVDASDSVFMALLLSWLRLCDARGVTMELVGLQSALFDMVRVSGLDSVLPIVGRPAGEGAEKPVAGPL